MNKIWPNIQPPSRSTLVLSREKNLDWERIIPCRLTRSNYTEGNNYSSLPSGVYAVCRKKGHPCSSIWLCLKVTNQSTGVLLRILPSRPPDVIMGAHTTCVTWERTWENTQHPGFTRMVHIYTTWACHRVLNVNQHEYTQRQTVNATILTQQNSTKHVKCKSESKQAWQAYKYHTAALLLFKFAQ